MIAQKNFASHRQSSSDPLSDPPILGNPADPVGDLHHPVVHDPHANSSRHPTVATPQDTNVDDPPFCALLWRLTTLNRRLPRP